MDAEDVVEAVPLGRDAAGGADEPVQVLLEERIYHMAGSTVPQALSEKTLHEIIRAAGRVPAERDSLYHVLKVHGPVPSLPRAANA